MLLHHHQQQQQQQQQEKQSMKEKDRPLLVFTIAKNLGDVHHNSQQHSNQNCIIHQSYRATNEQILSVAVVFGHGQTMDIVGASIATTSSLFQKKRIVPHGPSIRMNRSISVASTFPHTAVHSRRRRRRKRAVLLLRFEVVFFPLVRSFLAFLHLHSGKTKHRLFCDLALLENTFR